MITHNLVKRIDQLSKESYAEQFYLESAPTQKEESMYAWIQLSKARKKTPRVVLKTISKQDDHNALPLHPEELVTTAHYKNTSFNEYQAHILTSMRAQATHTRRWQAFIDDRETLLLAETRYNPQGISMHKQPIQGILENLSERLLTYRLLLTVHEQYQDVLANKQPTPQVQEVKEFYKEINQETYTQTTTTSNQLAHVQKLAKQYGLTNYNQDIGLLIRHATELVRNPTSTKETVAAQPTTNLLYDTV